MKPTIGRIVHYQLSDKDTLSDTTTIPAIVMAPGAAPGSGDWAGLYVASLKLIGTHGEMYLTNVPEAREPTPGHWNWPPRE